MITKVLAIFDVKSGAYRAPFFVPSLGVGIREFSDVVQDRERGGHLNKHPEDFILFHVADFEDTTSEFINVDSPVRLGIGTDFVEVGRPITYAPACVEGSNGSKEA